MTNFTDFLANVVELFVGEESAPRRGKKSPARTRRLAVESLENRELLAVTGAEWTQLQTLLLDEIPDEAPSTVVTTLLDIVDKKDGIISLREAINYASNGNTVTFDKNGTIVLNGNNLSINKSITIDGDGAITVDGGDQKLGVSGGIFAIGAYHDVTLVGLTITGRNAPSGGGISGGGMTATNCTITNKSAYNYGGGIFAGGTTSLYNSIIALNTDNKDIYRSSGTVQGFNNLTSYNAWNGSYGNNIVYKSTLPLFVDAANGDYRLAANSQAINKGDKARAVYADGSSILLDLAKNVRITGGTVDIGVYEYDGAPVVTTPVKPTLSMPTWQKGTAAVTKLGMNSFTLNWNAVTVATKYDIYLVGKVEPIATDVTGTFKNITGLQPGVKYQFQVVARNDGGEISASSTALTVTTLKAPPAPTAFAVKSGSVSTQNSITLSWVAPTKSMPADATLAGYEISYSYTDPVTKKVETVTANPNIVSTAISTTINYLPYASLSYTFTIKAKYTVNGSPIYSALATKSAKTAALNAPAFTVSTKETDNKADLDYGQLRLIPGAANSGMIVYEVYVGSRKVIDASIDGNLISGLSAGTKYTIFAYYENGDGTKSAVKSLAATTRALPAPTTLKTSVIGINAITVTWIAPSQTAIDKIVGGATLDGYKVRYSYTHPTSKQVIWSDWTSASSGDEFTNPPLANVKYTFYVSAKYTVDSKPICSNELLATAAVSPTAFVSPKLGTKVTDIGLGTATINWTKSTGISGEKIDGYTVRVLLGGKNITNDPAITITTLTATSTSATITGLAPKTKYTVQVIAKSGNLESLAAQTTVTTKAMPVVKPVKAADVKGQPPYTTNNSTQLEWSVPIVGSGEAVEYQVFIATTNTPAAFVLCATATDAGFSASGKQQFAITGLTANTQYYFKVVAKYSAGLTTVFGETIATAVGVKTLAFAAPSKLTETKTATTANSATITWTPPAIPSWVDATADVTYEVYYKTAAGTFALVTTIDGVTFTIGGDKNSVVVSGLTSFEHVILFRRCCHACER